MTLLNLPIGRPIANAVSVGLTPVQEGLTGLFRPVGLTVAAVVDFNKLRDENETLRSEVERQNAEIIKLREAEYENERLRAMLNYEASAKQYTLERVRIIALDPSSQVRSATIAGGLDRGFREGMIALSPAGNLVGRLVEVNTASSRILFIVDQNSAVNARILRADSRAIGVVGGLPGDKLVMRYVQQSEQLKVGDVVTTSGLGATYPKDLHIGKVVEIKKNDVDLFQEARIEPAVQFTRLDSVQVITNFLPTKLD